MKESLRDQIARLRTLSPKLNAVTDEATLLVEAVEHFLNEECKFGIPAFTEISSASEDDRGAEWDRGTRLEYSRIEGKFRLVVSEYETDPVGDTTISNRMAWTASPRDTKLWTIRFIPNLLERIAKRIEWTIRDAEEQSAVVKNHLREFGIISKEGM